MQTIHNDEHVSQFIQAARKSQIGLFAQFGGQGANYLDELRDLFHTHRELLAPVIKRAEMIMKEQSNSPEARYVYFTLSICVPISFSKSSYLVFLCDRVVVATNTMISEM